MSPDLARPFAVLAGAAACLVATVQFADPGLLLPAVLLLATLAVLSAIDVEERRIPNAIVLPASAAMLALQIAVAPDRALEWTLAAVGAAVLLFVFSRLNPAGLGMGDVKLALLLGAALGGGVIAALAVGSSLAALYGLARLVREGSAARRSTFPYAPFLAAGAAAVLLLS
jgi:leader peptidase (prepilin peptidase) / N-methyltransferase